MRPELVRGMLLACACALAGCKTYTLDGRVVAGDASYVEVVKPDDARLAQRGIPGVRIRVVSDPDALNRETIARGVTAPDGSFSLPIDKIGAGFLEYDVAVEARREGYVEALTFMPLPGDDRRVLVTLTPGESQRGLNESEFDSLMDEAEYYKRRQR